MSGPHKQHKPCGQRDLMRPTVVFARGTELLQPLYRAQTSRVVLASREQRLQVEQGKPRACVSPELTSIGEPCSFVAAASASLPARCGHAHSGYCHTYVTANNIQILGMNLARRSFWLRLQLSISESDADFRINRLFPVEWSIYRYNNSLYCQPILRFHS